MAEPRSTANLTGRPPRRRVRGIATGILLNTAWQYARPFGAFLILVASWHLIARYANLPSRILPAPGEVVAAFVDLTRKGILPAHIASSLKSLTLASVIGMSIAVPMGIAMGLNGRVAKFFYPLLNFFQSLSGIAWAPLFILWFGLNQRTIAATVNYTIMFPVVFNTLVGVRAVPGVLVDSVTTLGGRRWHVIRDVIIPGSLPNIVTGFRLGMAYGWRALIAAEMLVGAQGLGSLIFVSATFLQTARIIVGMVTIGLLWQLMDRLVLRPFEVATIARWGSVRL